MIGRENPQVYLHGNVLKVPTHLVGEYELMISDTEYMLFDVRDGAEAIGLPLLLTTTEVKRTFPLWQVRGAQIRDAKPGLTAKHVAHEAEHYSSN